MTKLEALTEVVMTYRAAKLIYFEHLDRRSPTLDREWCKKEVELRTVFGRTERAVVEAAIALVEGGGSG